MLLPWHRLGCRYLLGFDPSAALAVGRASSSNTFCLPPALSILHLACALSAEPSQAASTHAEPSCAIAAELEQEGVWPHPPVAMPAFGDLSCFDVYPSVCKDHATHPCLFPGCFNSALAVLVAHVGNTRVWKKWGHRCYLTEGNNKLINAVPSRDTAEISGVVA